MFSEALSKSSVSLRNLKRRYAGCSPPSTVLKASPALLLPLFVSMSAGAAVINGEELEELIDPTAPLFLAEPAENGQSASDRFPEVSSYRVNSILIRPNLRMAVVNSQRVAIGDTIGSAEVTDIQSESVTLNIGGEERVIALYGKSIKTISEGER